MSEQDNGKVSTLQRPTTDDPKAWRAYWETQGWPWRTEPEIDVERQKYLAERRNVTPNIEQGIYPFKDIRLNRADIEWLLSKQNQGQSTISEEMLYYGYSRGLDLRGADLKLVDLNRLPLSQIRGGLHSYEWREATKEQRDTAAVHLERTNLNSVDLRYSRLRFAHLEGADLRFSRFEGAMLVNTYFAGTADFRPADLRCVSFDGDTNLREVVFGDKKYGTARLADVQWNNVNLTVLDWTQLKMLGDEQEARCLKTTQGKIKNENLRLNEYKEAVRANRQLATVLQAQGLNENAAYFAYRAVKLQRIVLRIQKKFGQYLFSISLDLLAGYGYRPGRSVIWYLITIFGFALAYFAIGHLPFFPDAFVFSLTSFHGRGFFPGLGSENSLHNPLVIMAAFEAVVGLLIEISFIATFTQRFFGR